MKKNLMPTLLFAAIAVTTTNAMAEHGDMKGCHEKGGPPHMLKEMDTDKDGAVSRDEFNVAHGKMFDGADTNKDGKLTEEEMKAFHKKMHDEHHSDKDEHAKHEGT